MEIKKFFENNSAVAVAFSGGVDSAVLLLLAKKYAKRVKAYFVKAQFQPQFELDDARAVAALLDADMKIIELDVLKDETVKQNPNNRCYYCKKNIFSEIIKNAKKDGFSVILDGTNASDDISDRPGYRALREMNVYSPLKLCGYTKSDIRKLALKNKLPVANKPSYACLATRIPTGTKITDELLKKTEQAENALRKEGFENFRVRYLNGAAKLELGKNEHKLLVEKKERVYTLLSKLYDGVLLDLKEREDE